jgi:hypothetical protein
MSGTLTPKSTTGRLSANLSEMSQTPITVTPSTGRKSPKNRRFNVSKGNSLRKSLLKKRATKYAPKRTTFENSNINTYPALRSVFMSHKKNNAFNEYRKKEDKRKNRERQEALASVNNDAYLLLPGPTVIPVQPSEKRKARRRRNVEKYYPEPKELTHQESKMGGPRGQSKAVRNIRKGKNICAKCGKAISVGVPTITVNGKKQHKVCPEQKTYTMEGLPNNINKNYYRGNVPEMVNRSHKAANSKLYGHGVTPPKYTKFKEQPKPKKTGRFTVTVANQ